MTSPTRQVNKLTRKQFYTICESMKSEAENLADKNYDQAARIAGEALDLPINGQQIRDASEVTDVKLSPMIREQPKPDLCEIKALIGILAAGQRTTAQVVEQHCPREFKAAIEGVQVNAGRVIAELKKI